MTDAAAVERALGLVHDVPDFPTEGVVFKDISPLLADPEAFAAVVDALAEVGRGADGSAAVDAVVGVESRGFLFGVPVAQALGVGFVPVRKPGKLPREVHRVSYELEYGSETLEIHTDALDDCPRVLLVDDVLATGGTLAAAAELVGRCGGSVHAASLLLELSFLDGRAAVPDLEVHAVRTL